MSLAWSSLAALLFAALYSGTSVLDGDTKNSTYAEKFAKRFPERTRTVVLDSVVPNTLVLGQAITGIGAFR